MSEKKKQVNFKFTEQEFTMYNTLMTAALVRVVLERAKTCEDPQELEDIFTNKEYIEGDFKDDISEWIDKMSNGYFSSELFKIEEEIDGE